MEWLDKIVWTNVAKSVGFFAVSMVIVAITSYMAGYAKGHAAGFNEGLEVGHEIDEWLDDILRETQDIKEKVSEISVIVKSLVSPPYRQP